MEYLSVKNEANIFLLDYGIDTLPVRFEDLLDICKKLGYYVVTYQDAEEQDMLPDENRKEIERLMEIRDGFTLQDESAKIIYYRQNLSYELNAKIIAHELGHIALGHSGTSGILGQSSDREKVDRLDFEANIFMRQVLSPPCVLYALGISTVKDINKFTMLDHAEARFITQELRQYPRFEMLSDKNVLCQFKDFINTVKQTFNALPTSSMLVPTLMSEPTPTPKSAPKPVETPRDEKAAPKPVQAKAKPNNKSPDMVAFWGASICAFLLGGVLVFTLLLLFYGGI